MSRMLLLRHAESAWNAEQRWQGWGDSPLTTEGRAAAEAWAARVASSFGAIVTSDLLRARQTASIIATSLNLHVSAELSGLREQDLGAWTGLTKVEIKQRWPDRLRERPRRPVDGETAEDLLARLHVALIDVADLHRARSVLIVTHAGVIRELERAEGISSTPIPHLEGRWLKVDRSIALGETTSGRLQGVSS